MFELRLLVDPVFFHSFNFFFGIIFFPSMGVKFQQQHYTIRYVTCFLHFQKLYASKILYYIDLRD